MFINKKNLPWISLAAFLFLCFSVEIIGGVFTRASVTDWYLSINKPVWNPPSWVFGPVWTLLYIMIAVAGWLLFMEKESKERSRALVLYFIQLFLNLLWSFLFFFLKNPLLGLIDIVLLFISIGVLMYLSWSVSKKAALLLIPYFLWTGYATSLNIGIWVLN